MSGADQVDQLSRFAFREAGQIRILAERMAALQIQPDRYSPADLRHLADSLQGMALRCAMSTGNTALLNELTGRDAHEIDGDN